MSSKQLPHVYAASVRKNQGWCFIPFAETGDLVSVHIRENSKRVFSILISLFLGQPVCASVGVINFMSEAFIPAVQHPSRARGQ